MRLIVLTLYLGLLLFVGFYQGRKVSSDADYQIGGRSIPGWAAALSERATPEICILHGWISRICLCVWHVLGIWPSIGLAVGNILAWTVIARKMQQEAEDVDAITYVDWAAKRHQD